jgi:hypothetical protein
MDMIRHNTITEKSYLLFISPKGYLGYNTFGYFIILEIRSFICCANCYEIDMATVGVIEIAKMHFLSVSDFINHEKTFLFMMKAVRSENEPYLVIWL